MTETADSRTRIERYDPTDDRAALAGALGGARPGRDGPARRVEAQVLPADDVPVPVGRPAHRPLVHRDADRRAGALPPDARLQRVLPDRLRCVRAAGRERGDQERRPPVHLDDGEHRERCAASSGRWARRSPGSTRSSPPTRPTTAGTSGCSCGSWRPGLAYRRDVAGRLVPQRRDAGPRAGRGPGPPLLALRRAGREARPGAVVPADDRSTPTSCCDFDGIDWPEPIRIQQTNWIGRSEGAEIDFETAPDDHQPGGDDPARLHDAARHAVRRHVHGPGAGAPAGRAADRTRTGAPRSRPTSTQARRRTEIERLSTDREKTGVALGADAINPVNGERIPIFIADYVLAGYGTGAIMAVPAHDERDFAFAQQFGLPIRRVVAAPGRGRRRADGRRLRRPRRGRAAGQQRPLRRPAGRRGRQGHRRVAGRDRPGRAQGHLPPARLADQPPALLGHADPGHLLRDATASCRSPTRTCRSCCPRPSTTTAAATTRSTTTRRSVNVDVPDVRPAGAARDRHDGHVRRLVVVLVPLPVAAQERRPGRPRDGRALDAGRPVHRRRRARRDAPAVQPLLHQGDGATSA